MVSELSNFVLSAGTEHQRRMQRVLNIIIDESMDELAEMDEASLSTFMHNMACIIEWTATGNLSVLPPELIPFACKIDGINYLDFTATASPDDSIPTAELLPAELNDGSCQSASAR